MGQGAESARSFLESHPDITEEVVEKVIEATGIDALKKRLKKNIAMARQKQHEEVNA